jgi:transglutaminase-like putative cysteine protease
VQLSPQVVACVPHRTAGRRSCRIRCASSRCSISSTGSRIRSRTIWPAGLPEKTTEFRVTVDLVAEMAVYNPFDFFLEPGGEVPVHLRPASPRAGAVSGQGELTPRFGIRRQHRPHAVRTLDFLVALNQRLQQDIRYLIRMEPGVQTPRARWKTLGLVPRHGLAAGADLRHLGLAARFVSGYLIQLTPDVKAVDGPVGAEADFTDLHAWCEVYLPGAGWIGLDPTSGLLAGEGHIPLACTPEPGSAAPVSGAVDDARCSSSTTCRSRASMNRRA